MCDDTTDHSLTLLVPHRCAVPPAMLDDGSLSAVVDEEKQEKHWQDDDAETMKTLDAMKARGTTHLLWRSCKMCCEGCTSNDGVKVSVGERFPSGAYTTPNCDECQCTVEEIKDQA